jgi:hypothetical protein
LADGASTRCHFHERTSELVVTRPKLSAASAQGAGLAPALTLDGLAISYARANLLQLLLGRRPDVPHTVADITLRVGASLAKATTGSPATPPTKQNAQLNTKSIGNPPSPSPQVRTSAKQQTSAC